MCSLSISVAQEKNISRDCKGGMLPYYISRVSEGGIGGSWSIAWSKSNWGGMKLTCFSPPTLKKGVRHAEKPCANGAGVLPGMAEYRGGTRGQAGA